MQALVPGSLRVTLLGTGCPIVDVHRYGPATLIEAMGEGGAEAWLVDCGSGVTQRLVGHGTPGSQLTGVLLTHLHSDHTIDLMQLLISSWHQGRIQPLKVFGPKGTRKFLMEIWEAWRPEFEQRSAHEIRPLQALAWDIVEIDGNWKLETPAVSIAATEVRHQPVSQAFGFRFDTYHEPSGNGASVVVSGDTAYCPELIHLAKDCDLLVHEVFVHRSYLNQRTDRDPQQTANVMAYHTRSDEVGRVANEANAGALALTHFVPTVFDQAQLEADVRAEYQGNLFVGVDLMCLEVAQGKTSVLRSDTQPGP